MIALTPIQYTPDPNQGNILQDRFQWATFVSTAANAQGSRKTRPYIYDVALSNGTHAYYLLNAADKKNFVRTNQATSCKKLKLDDIATISQSVLPTYSTQEYDRTLELCQGLLDMAKKFEAKDSSGLSAAGRKISNNFSNLFKTSVTKRELPPTPAQNARNTVHYRAAITRSLGDQPPAPTTLDKVHTFFTNLVKSPNFSRTIKGLAIAGAIALVVLTGRIEVIAMLAATIIIQHVVNKHLLNN